MIKVALIHRDSYRVNEGTRVAGWWAYDVPEFEITHYAVPHNFITRKSDFKKHDLIWMEDGKLHGEIISDYDIPVAYHIVDSTLSEAHYEHRIGQAKLNADFIFVDWDKLERFEGLGKPVRRFGYCVNDLLYKDYEQPKTIDVGVYQHPTEAREKVNQWLQEFCRENDYRLLVARLPQEKYALALNYSKVVINVNRNPFTRSHRIFDGMASRSCVITSTAPIVSGEERKRGLDYLEWNNLDDLRYLLKFALEGDWQDIANSGYELVQNYHTWQVRAKELHKTLGELPLILHR